MDLCVRSRPIQYSAACHSLLAFIFCRVFLYLSVCAHRFTVSLGWKDSSGPVLSWAGFWRAYLSPTQPSYLLDAHPKRLAYLLDHCSARAEGIVGLAQSGIPVRLSEPWLRLTVLPNMRFVCALLQMRLTTSVSGAAGLSSLPYPARTTPRRERAQRTATASGKRAPNPCRLIQFMNFSQEITSQHGTCFWVSSKVLQWLSLTTLSSFSIISPEKICQAITPLP